MKDKPRARRGPILCAAALILALSTPASAQPAGLGLGRALGGLPVPRVQVPALLPAPLSPEGLLSLRVDRLDALVRAHPREIERDIHGMPVVRGEVLAIAPAAEALAKVRQAGFEVKQASDGDDEIGLVVLRAPDGMGAREAVKRLRRLDPAGSYDFNHLYLPSGEAAPTGGPPVPSAWPSAPSEARIGLIDTGFDVMAPVFARARIEQRGFAAAAAKPAPHGAAVASLLVGEAAPFHGAAPGGWLYAADVYCGAADGGAADALVRAFSWLAARKVVVVNVSLVGPPNAALAAVVKAMQARGIVVVAAVGNDGPAAPPSYPASYPGVVAVTGVDARGRVLLEAGRAEHLDFAAPGADMAAAAARGGGFRSVRGTSFAAPLVAGRLAALMAERGLSPAAAQGALAREGKPGKGYGRALVGAELRTPPAAVHASTSAD